MALSPAEAAGLLLRTRAQLARAKLSHFIRLGWNVLEPGSALLWNWHIDAIADHVQWLLGEWMKHRADPAYEQQVRDLLVNVPPGTAKSRIVSVYAPAWIWLHDPTWRVICMAASQQVVHRDSMLCRELIGSHWYQETFKPAWFIRDDQDAKEKFENTLGGFRVAVPFKSVITGNRADALFIDDPHDAYEVHSQKERQKVLDKYDQAIRNRVNEPNHSTRLLIMQRLHEEDLSGHWLRQKAELEAQGKKSLIEHLCLPMEFEEKRRCRTTLPWIDPRKMEGDILHEARFPREVLDKEKQALGSIGYAGQMQQFPVPTAGGLFPRSVWPMYQFEGQGQPGIRTVGRDKRTGRLMMDQVLISADLSVKETVTGSRTAIIVIGAKGADRFVLEVVAEPMDIVKQMARIQELVARFPEATRVVIEDKANGAPVITQLKSKIAGLVPYNPHGTKEARAVAVQPQIESGNVYLLQGARWMEDWLHEFEMFPNGAKDDLVDALSQALTYLATGLNLDKIRAMGLFTPNSPSKDPR